MHAETEGNPFFVREILRHLTETEAIIQQDGRFGSRPPSRNSGIPEGVRELVGRRPLATAQASPTRCSASPQWWGTAFELPVVGTVG